MKTCNNCKKECDKLYQINNNLYECVDSRQCRENVTLELSKLKYKLLIRHTYYITSRLVITFIDCSNPYSTEDFITELYKIRINCINKKCYLDKDGLCKCLQDNVHIPKTLFNGIDYCASNDPILEDSDSVYNEYIKKFRSFYNDEVSVIIKIVLDDNVTEESSLYDKYIDNDFNSNPPLDNR